MRYSLFIAVLLTCLFSAPGLPQVTNTAVDVELVLAVDGSRSVDSKEFALQMDGIAQAFRNPRFLAVLRAAAPRGIAVTLVQWAGNKRQLQVVGWHYVDDRNTAAGFADKVANAGRKLMPGPTAIGSAIRFSYLLIENNRFNGKSRVIDISGDGYNNSGQRPEIARDEAADLGIIINGLTVLNEVSGLDRYFSDRVIAGPGAFVIEVLDFEHVATAFVTKLIREVSGDKLALKKSRTILLPVVAGLVRVNSHEPKNNYSLR